MPRRPGSRRHRSAAAAAQTSRSTGPSRPVGSSRPVDPSRPAGSSRSRRTVGAARSATATLGLLAALGLAGCGSQPPAQAGPACPIPLPTTSPEAEWPLRASTPPGCPDGGVEPGRYVADLP